MVEEPANRYPVTKTDPPEPTCQVCVAETARLAERVLVPPVWPAVVRPLAPSVRVFPGLEADKVQPPLGVLNVMPERLREIVRLGCLAETTPEKTPWSVTRSLAGRVDQFAAFSKSLLVLPFQDRDAERRDGIATIVATKRTERKNEFMEFTTADTTVGLFIIYINIIKN